MRLASGVEELHVAGIDAFGTDLRQNPHGSVRFIPVWLATLGESEPHAAGDENGSGSRTGFMTAEGKPFVIARKLIERG